MAPVKLANVMSTYLNSFGFLSSLVSRNLVCFCYSLNYFHLQSPICNDVDHFSHPSCFFLPAEASALSVPVMHAQGRKREEGRKQN